MHILIQPWSPIVLPGDSGSIERGYGLAAYALLKFDLIPSTTKGQRLKHRGYRHKSWRMLSIVHTKPSKPISFWIRTFANFTNPKSLNTLITQYMRNGQIKEAQKLFDVMPQRNTVSWNVMVRGYFENGEFHQALHMYNLMPHRDLFSYNTMISGLMKYGDIDNARRVFSEMPFKDIVSWNSMIGGYVNNSCMNEALDLFDQMPSRNVISWNLVMSGFVNIGSFDLVDGLFWKMPETDVASCTMMISVLGRVGRVSEAREIFEKIPEKDVRAWKAMVMGYIENGDVGVAEELFWEMPERDVGTWNCMIGGLVEKGCINDAVRYFSGMPCKTSQSWNSVLLGLIRRGLTEEAHAFFEKSPFNDVVTWTNLMIGYFELKKVEVATMLFELMPDRDGTSWNAMIYGLGENDHGEDGLNLFMRIKEEGLFPDEATFTSALSICSNLPSLDFGEQAHGQIIKTGFDCSTAVSNAIITMYSRCGSMHSAFLVFSCMPSHDNVSWNSMISGYAYHGSGMKALEMFKGMRSMGVQPDQITFIGVLSACSHTGLIEEGQYYFDFMRYKCFLRPTCEHYSCMVDLLGRYGLIEEAMNFIKRMKEDGVEVSTSVWKALLGASRIHGNVTVSKLAAEEVLEMEPYNTGAYMILSEMYMNNGRRKDCEDILAQMKERGGKKQPGCSWIEVNNSVHVFLAGDSSHPDFYQVQFVLDLLTLHADAGRISRTCKVPPVGCI